MEMDIMVAYNEVHGSQWTERLRGVRVDRSGLPVCTTPGL